MVFAEGSIDRKQSEQISRRKDTPLDTALALNLSWLNDKDFGNGGRDSLD